MARIEPKPYQPDTAVPPGLTIEELLTERPDRDDDRTARSLGLTPDDFRALLRGDHEITPDLAARLAAEFPAASIPAHVWENLDRNYRATLGRLAAKPFIPAEVFPPGEYVQDELVARGITTPDFGAAVGLTDPECEAFFRGEIPLTADMAGKIADMLGTSTQIWENLEKTYREGVARQA